MTMFPKTQPIRLKGKAMEALRELVWHRDHHACVKCFNGVRLEGGHWDSMHLSHIVSRGAGGSDTPENTVCKCLACHIGIEHSYGKSGVKPCPPKEKVA